MSWLKQFLMVSLISRNTLILTIHLDKMANTIYKDNSNGNLAKSYFKSLLNGGLSSSAPSRNLYSNEFTKYLKDNGITNDYIVSIMTLKSYLQYFKKMPKSGTEFTL